MGEKIDGLPRKQDTCLSQVKPGDEAVLRNTQEYQAHSKPKVQKNLQNHPESKFSKSKYVASKKEKMKPV